MPRKFCSYKKGLHIIIQVSSEKKVSYVRFWKDNTPNGCTVYPNNDGFKNCCLEVFCHFCKYDLNKYKRFLNYIKHTDIDSYNIGKSILQVYDRTEF